VFASTYMGLDSFDPEVTTLEKVMGDLEVEDRWLLSRVNRLVKLYREAMEDLRIHDAARALRSFILEDVSRFYIRLIRRRVWEEADTPSKRAAYATLYKALKTWLALAAPIIPFTTEYLYQHFVRPAESSSPASVHLLSMPEVDEHLIDDDLERDFEIARAFIEAALSARATAGLKLRRPVRRVVVAAVDERALKALRRLANVIAEMVNAKTVEVVGTDFFEKLGAYKVEPNLGEIGRDYRRLTPTIVKLLEDKGVEVAGELLARGYYEVELEGVKVKLEPRHVDVKVEYPEWLSVRKLDYGIVAVDTRITVEEEAEGYAREVVRRVQHMRKELRLSIEDRVEVWVWGDDEIVNATRLFEEYVRSETRAVKINYGKPAEKVYAKDWDIEDKVVSIGIKRV